jgi:glycine cleavage system H protein
MSQINPDVRYADSHEWVSVEGNVATIGISDHAQGLLGDLVYVELPDIDTDVAKGTDVAVVESVKAASDVYAPVSGRVIEVNDGLEDAPELANEAPYTEGWLFKVELSDATEVDELLSADEYQTAVDAA